MEDTLFGRISTSWRVGDVAPMVFQKGEPVDFFSIPLSEGWALFRLGKYSGQSEDPEGDIVTPGGSFFRGGEIFSRIDATFLKEDRSMPQLSDFLKKASLLKAKNVCLFPHDVPYALEFFPAPATVISFPHGADSKGMKAENIKLAEGLGAGEFDVVADLTAIRGNDWKTLREEFHTLRAATDKTIKVILETSLFTQEEILHAGEIAGDVGIDYLKTSSGRNGRGASLEDIETMSKVEGISIKASGGIRSKEDAQILIDAGADIIGASNLLPFMD